MTKTATLRKNDLEALREALRKCDSLISAALDDEKASCAIFRSYPGFQRDAFTEEQKRAVRLYVDSWIREPLAAVLSAVDGDRTYANEGIILSHAGNRGIFS